MYSKKYKVILEEFPKSTMTWAFRFADDISPEARMVKIPNEIWVNGLGKDPH